MPTLFRKVLQNRVGLLEDTSACQAAPGVPCPVPVSTIHARRRQSGEAPKEGQKDGEPAL